MSKGISIAYQLVLVGSSLKTASIYAIASGSSLVFQRLRLASMTYEIRSLDGELTNL